MALPSMSEFSGLGMKIITNPQLFSLMKMFKSTIQTQVIPQMTMQEQFDVRDSRLNESVVSKLITLASNQYLQYQTPEALYCAAMSVGTIIKEYEWGTQYVSGSGLYELAKRIYNQ